MRYFILDEDKNLVECDVLDWAEWSRDIANRRVGITKVGDLLISTVFLGMAHTIYPNNREGDFFETMVFRNEKEIICYRYDTYNEARRGHRKWIRKLRSKIFFKRMRAGFQQAD